MKNGFTLIEMMVAVTIFAIVMMIGVGALLSLVETNHRAQALNAVMSNLNAALEGMSRSIRVGTSYYCATSLPPNLDLLTVPQDCAASPGHLLAFEASGGVDGFQDQVVYRLNGTQLERSLDGGQAGTWVALTAPEVTITAFDLYVVGANDTDQDQPRVLMKIEGSAEVPGGTTNFEVQTSVTQRIIDF